MVTENSLKIIDDTAGSLWNSLEDSCPTLTKWGLDTLKAGLGAHTRTVVLEPDYICKDHRNLHSNFYSKKFKQHSPACARLHFFSRGGIRESQFLFDPASVRNDYIGYTVVRPVNDRCLGRTIIDPWRVGRSIDDNFFCLRTEFRSHVHGAELSAYGYPYMSQDGEATVCAHTALWGVCRYLSERYKVYREFYPYDLVALTPDSHGRRVPYRGLRYQDYSSILTQFGCFPVLIQTKDSADDEKVKPEELRYLSYYVESGFPILASFAGHVVTIVGHTLDKAHQPCLHCEALVDSTAFFKQLIVVDDNCFPYQLLGRQTDPMNYYRYSIDSIRVAICPLPEKVYLPAEKARKQCLTTLDRIRQNQSANQQLAAGRDEPLVVRMLITTGSSLKKRRAEKAVKEDRLIDPLAIRIGKFHLPHFIWLMEVSPLSCYREGKCTAEIVLDATANEQEMCLLYARVGQNLLLHDSSISVKNVPTFAGLFEQYTHNLGEQ